MQPKLTNIAFVLFHIGAVAALFFFSWNLLFLACGTWFVAGSPGIGIGFHRLLTHRGFKTYKLVEYALTFCGCLALQGGAIWWVAVHRAHHRYTELPGVDPHTPHDGKFWSHMGWLIRKDPRLYQKNFLTHHAPDLCKDPVHVVLHNFSWVPVVIWGVGLGYFYGFLTVLWGVAVPVVVGWHFTWLVNSATHLWGKQPFKTAATGDSRNNWWVALLTFGEGWHNNHHAHPVSARHGFVWYQVDVNWYGIQLLELMGLAWAVSAYRKE